MHAALLTDPMVNIDHPIQNFIVAASALCHKAQISGSRMHVSTNLIFSTLARSYRGYSITPARLLAWLSVYEGFR